MSVLIDELGYYHEDHPLLADTADWVHAVTLDDGGGGYEWAVLTAFWSPSARRYFWVSGSGCSCNSITDYAQAVSDFEHGDRAALDSALIRFAADEYRSMGDQLDRARGDLRDFQEVSA